MFKLTTDKLSVILILMVYSNVLKLINLYQPVAFILDAWLIICIISYMWSHGTKKYNNWIIVLIIGLEIIGFLEIFNPNIYNLFSGVLGFRKSLLMWVPFLAGLILKFNYDDVHRLIKRILLFSYPILLYGAKQFFFYSRFDDKFLLDNMSNATTNEIFGQQRMASVFSGASFLGTFSAIIILLVIYYWKYISPTSKIFYFSEIILSIICLYGSLSRASVFGCIISVFVFCLWNMEKIKRNIIFILGFVSVFIINLLIPFSKIGNWVYSDNVLQRFIGSMFNPINDSRFLSRYTSLSDMYSLIYKHIFIGYGVGSSQTGSATGYYIPTRGDNLFFSYINELGIIGFVFLCLLLIIIFKRLLNNIINNSINTFFIMSMSLFLSFFVMMFSATISSMYPVVEIAFAIIGLGCGKVKGINKIDS
ncbi:hypothetical protein DEJ53_08835 [Weissella confusa]|uniref:O-antigen ligase family protein n=1 Tax=Weissella confusa TaxID=1583 RepID=UPI000DCA967D|nr:O-antigen ligase family protein [Weissella confusa]RAU05449.1 hypothetical protein DEJ53_08835 [Weissella confusa]